MILSLNDDQFLENPDEATVVSAIRKLEIENFAILRRGDEDFVQTYYNDDGTFELEFRAGSDEEHYRATDETLTNEDVAKAFAAYLTGRSDWSRDWNWEKLEFDDDFQGDLTSENAYLINGEEYEKIAVGSERPAIDLIQDRCPGCAAAAGQYHEPGCDLEECPCCHEPICQCECD